MMLLSYLIALLIGTVGACYLIAVVIIKTALFYMDKSLDDDDN